MPDVDRIVRVRAATILHQLEVPIVFGTWIMRHREFFLVRVDAESGLSGFAYGLTRDGPLAAIVDRTIAPQYVGEAVADPEASFFKALWANNAVHAAGIGMRALSVVDCAAWDLAAKAKGQNITAYLGGERRRMPVTGIVGYPPSISPEETVDPDQVLCGPGLAALQAAHRTHPRRVHRPAAGRPRGIPGRLAGHRRQLPAQDRRRRHRVRQAARRAGHRLVRGHRAAGDAQMVREIREGISTPVAMGDEQGGSYHPQALLKFDAVDFNRAGRDHQRRHHPAAADPAAGRGARQQAHDAHVPAHPLARCWARSATRTAPSSGASRARASIPWTTRSSSPSVRDGLMDPLPDLPGFGMLVDPAWISGSTRSPTPHGLLDDL